MPALAEQPAASPAGPTVHTLELPRDSDRDPVLTVRFAPGLLKGCGVMTAVQKRAEVTYVVVELPTRWPGRAFNLSKLPGAEGDDKDNESYDVFVCGSDDEADHQCGCKAGRGTGTAGTPRRSPR